MVDGSAPIEKPVIAVAGASSIDMTLRQPPLEWVGGASQDSYTPEMVEDLAHPPELGLGGNGAASAYVLGVLGLRVLLNGPTGEDAAGTLIEGWLKEASVESVAPPAEATMFAVTPVDGQSRRLVCLQYPSPRIDWRLSAKNDQATWLLLAAHSQVAASELKEAGDTLRVFKSKDGVTVLDTGIGWMRTNQADQMKRIWADVSLLIGTLDELRFWSGLEYAEDIARLALSVGVGRVVIKMGAEGAGWMNEDGVYAHQPARRIERSNVSVGAGDGFNAALIAQLVQGESLKSAVDFAQTVAAKIVEIGNGVIGWGSCKDYRP
jgi:sugar/nucleoside kinase (ribokinase family)